MRKSRVYGSSLPKNEVACLMNTWLYMPTNKTTAAEAFDELLEVASRVGIEIYTNNVVLRDEDGDDIDSCVGNA